MGDCVPCPDLPVSLEPGVDTAASFHFQEWRKGETPKLNEKGERRVIFSLHETTLTVGEGVSLLKVKAKELSKHVFTSYNQWEAKRVTETSLSPGQVLIVDDYQQNQTIELGATPTSTVYGAKQTNVMEFPLVAYWREQGKEAVSKATITFVSDDLLHDHQQVGRMEARAVEILMDKTGLKFHTLFRFSDGCGAQFKSRFSTADLVTAGERILKNKEAQVTFSYFASNEGKSESDTAGSAFKCRVESMCLRNPELVILCAADLVREVNKLTPDSTNKYSFVVVEEFPVFTRVLPHLRAEVPISGIRKLHEIGYRAGGIRAKRLSCLTCLWQKEECESCQRALRYGKRAPGKVSS